MIPVEMSNSYKIFNNYFQGGLVRFQHPKTLSARSESRQDFRPLSVETKLLTSFATPQKKIETAH
jgi:hypothetical protein